MIADWLEDRGRAELCVLLYPHARFRASAAEELDAAARVELARAMSSVACHVVPTDVTGRTTAMPDGSLVVTGEVSHCSPPTVPAGAYLEAVLVRGELREDPRTGMVLREQVEEDLIWMAPAVPARLHARTTLVVRRTWVPAEAAECTRALEEAFARIMSTVGAPGRPL